MDSVRGALPGVHPGLLRLSDDGDAKPARITLLTTEHYNLQTQRAATISEGNGRATVFLGAVSAGLLALASGDEEGSVILGSRWQPLQKMLSVAGSVAAITSVVLGGDVGAIVYGCRASLFAAILAGTAAALILAVLTALYQWKDHLRAGWRRIGMWLTAASATDGTDGGWHAAGRLQPCRAVLPARGVGAIARWRAAAS